MLGHAKTSPPIQKPPPHAKDAQASNASHPATEMLKRHASHDLTPNMLGQATTAQAVACLGMPEHLRRGGGLHARPGIAHHLLM
jgi:hypothetical protein